MSIQEVRTTPPPVSLAKPVRKATGKHIKTELDSAMPVRFQQERKEELPSALTTSEKAYFEQLFPNATEEVKRYNPYQKDGGNVEIRLGTLMDRRG